MENRDSQQEEDHTKKDLKRSAENAQTHHAPEAEGVIHAPLVSASSSPAQLTDEVSGVSEAKRRRMRRVTFVENVEVVEAAHVESSSAMDSSASGSSNNPNLQTEGRGAADRNAAASQGRPPRSPIGPPPAQRMKPDKMPYVYTTGPSGRRVYGFLYRYSKIMCVCHGEFFTPGQFVEHGGGGVVEHPNRHIIVTPFPFPC